MLSERSHRPIVTSRLASLNGWRALSIALVLGAHSRHTVGFPRVLELPFLWLFDGELGVRFFFVISGFLITWLMLLESEELGRVNLKHFYARRALRILPVYSAFLLTLLGFELFTPYKQPALTWITDLTFTKNFTRGNWASGHLWSLSVEEQFYLLWPTIFVISGLAFNFRRALLVLLIPVFVAPVCRIITNLAEGGSSQQMFFLAPLAEMISTAQSKFPIFGTLFSDFSFFNHCDSLAWGAACAFLLARCGRTLSELLTIRVGRALSLALMLILLPYILGHLHQMKWFTGPFGSTLQACGFGMLLLQSVLAPKWGFYRVLNWRWVSQIGILSYSLYIWQQIFCARPEEFGLGRVWWMSFPGWLLAVFAVASVSYYGFERPLLKLRARFRDGAKATPNLQGQIAHDI